MRLFKYFICFIIVIFLGISTSDSPYGMKSRPVGEDISKEEVLLGLIMQGINASHYQNVAVDDAFSEKVFTLYLERIDYYKRFLLQSDIDQLNEYFHLIDDQINIGSYEFFDLSLEMIDQRIARAALIYKDILKKPFDFTKDEMIELDADKLEFSKNEKELRESWRKYLKYLTLSKLNDRLTIQAEQEAKTKDGEDDQSDNEDIIEIKSLKDLEIEMRKKVLEGQDDLFRRIGKIVKSDRLTTYINTIINIFDPHTSYFPPKDKENFDISLSGRLEGIGAQLQEKDGYIKVSRIVIGSACWREGQLQAGDIILEVGQGKDDPVDIVDMRIDDAVKLIRGKKGTEVRLTIKKIDGSIIVIPIIRDVVLLEETYAKSVILQIDDQKKRIGYIKLPKFYADFNKVGGRNCADDVEIELEKLAKENIGGLIIDLRNNEGGSLTDAVKITGLFIEKGPVVQVKARKGDPYIYEDKDPKMQYDGPLVVLVNSFSASASEIFAAAIQDYHRGIIIGSGSTYGKGTVQSFYNLDRFIAPSYEAYKPLGFIKLTVQKFYRIDGGATQLKGVIPDIIIPDSYSFLDFGEKELDNVIPWDEIGSLQYDDDNFNTSDYDAIKTNSQSRVKNNTNFNLIRDYAEKLKRDKDNTTISLHLEKYQQEQQRLTEERKKYDSINETIPDLNIFTLQANLNDSESDTTSMARTASWHKTLKKDSYLYEAISVVLELE